MFAKAFSYGGALIGVLLVTPTFALAGPGGHGGGGHFGGAHFGGAHLGGGHYAGFGGLHYGGYHSGYPYAWYGGRYHHDGYRHHGYYGYYPYFGLYGGYYPYYGGYYGAPTTILYGAGDSADTVGANANEPVEVAVPATVQPDGSAQLTVDVPPSARVWIDGTATTSTGAVRKFTTPLLKPGSRYTYQIKATWNDNGHERTQTQTVGFIPGDHLTVDFPAPPVTSPTAAAAATN